MASPNPNLFSRLSQQHLDPAENFTACFTCLTKESSFARIVNEIVSQPHPAKLLGRRGRLVNSRPACSHRRGVDYHVEPAEVLGPSRSTSGLESLGQVVGAFAISRHQRRFGAGLAKRPKHCPRSAAGSNHGTSYAAKIAQFSPQRRRESFRVSVVAEQLIAFGDYCV